jgi:hypothetical protein
MSVEALLHRRESTAGELLVLAALSSACFGASIGSYVGGVQIVYAAIKMPIYFLGTLGISFTAMYVFAARELRAGETFAVALETVALTTVALAALAPLEALVSVSCPKPSIRAYSFLVLLLTGSVGTAGISGVVRAYRRLGSVRLTVAWVLIYQFVGTQMAWLLRPWISDGVRGDRFLPLRANLHGNFYEAVFNAFLGIFK